jgi:glycosyltransferase involved in cell wall biosynthesis
MNLEVVAIIALALAAIPAVMFLWNTPQVRRLWRAATKYAPAEGISVLIPARNEATNIRGALTAVLANRDAKFEVVVLDDHSEDDTPAIVREFMAEDARVRLEPAPALPTGWCGKQHACHVLAQHARNPLLLFVDADVRLAPDALSRLSAFMTRSKDVNHASAIVNSPALASGVPRQLTGTLFEKLLIPLIHFVLLGFLPVWRMRRCAKPAYGAGCGQLFIARADAYHAVGGHAAIRDSLHDGVKLPRAFRRAGFHTDLFDATDLATCRMYHNGSETLAGLTKNAHEGLASPAQIGPWTLLLFGGHVLPWLLLACAPWLSLTTVKLAAVAAGLSLLPRILAALRFQQSWLGAFLHPLGVLIFLGIQWRALFRSFRRQPQSWKGRTYAATPATATPPLRSRPENAMAGK